MIPPPWDGMPCIKNNAMRPVIRNTNPAYQIPDPIYVYDFAVCKTITASGYAPVVKYTDAWSYNRKDILSFMADSSENNAGADQWSTLSPPGVKAINYLIVNVFTKGRSASGNIWLKALGQNNMKRCNIASTPIVSLEPGPK